MVLVIGACILARAETRPTPLASIKVRADRAWTRTSFTIKKGQQVTIKATGSVTSSGVSIGPNGATGTKRLADPESSFPLASAQPVSLIGRVAGGPPFFIGTSSMITALSSGEIELGINADQLSDNRGEWSAQIYGGNLAAGVDPTRIESSRPGSMKPSSKPEPKPVTATDPKKPTDSKPTDKQKPQDSAASRNPNGLQRGESQAPDGKRCPAYWSMYEGTCYHCPTGWLYTGKGMCEYQCEPGEHKYDGACWKCPSGFHWIGLAMCRENK